MRLLEIRDLRVTFETACGAVPAAAGVDIEISPGEIVGLVGESGCGKTVTALSVMRLLAENAVVSGEIRFQGEDLLALGDKKMRALRGDRISMIFQEPTTSLNPVLPIGYQLCEPLVRHRGVSFAEAFGRAVEVLELVQVPGARERMRAFPHQLSGGLCQRVMIAMALICEPDLLIADEPTTALDVTIQAQILDLLRDMRKRTGTAMLMITHDLGVVAELCDRVYVMYAGHIMEQANVFRLFDNPLHPYTDGLMRSVPATDVPRAEERRLYSIPGMVPALSSLPPGCPFAPRCEVAFAACADAIPPLRPTEEGHCVRCLRCDAREEGIGR